MKATIILMILAAAVAAVLLWPAAEWDAVGYRSREHPDETRVFIGSFRSEAEARIAAKGFLSATPGGDYELALRSRSGGYVRTTR